MLKVSENILNNPSQIQKYGDLNAARILKALSKCRPALNLLFMVGFAKSTNNKRFVWTNTNKNVIALKYVHDTLKSMMNDETTTEDENKMESVTTSAMNVVNKWQCKACTLINEATSTICQACHNQRGTYIQSRIEVTSFHFVFECDNCYKPH